MNEKNQSVLTDQCKGKLSIDRVKFIYVILENKIHEISRLFPTRKGERITLFYQDKMVSFPPRKAQRDPHSFWGKYGPFL